MISTNFLPNEPVPPVTKTTCSAQFIEPASIPSQYSGVFCIRANAMPLHQKRCFLRFVNGFLASNAKIFAKPLHTRCAKFPGDEPAIGSPGFLWTWLPGRPVQPEKV